MYGHVLELADVRPKCREFRKRRIRKSRSAGCARQKYSDYRVRENTIEYYKKKKKKRGRLLPFGQTENRSVTRTAENQRGQRHEVKLHMI